MKFAPATGKSRNESAFTLAEVLAALLFMAIVIPVAVEALHVASLSGEIATRKTEAARVAEKVLNESIVTTNWSGSTMSGSVVENNHEFQWTLNNEEWAQDSSMQMLTAEVKFTAGAREYSVNLKTLVSPPTSVGVGGGMTAGAQ